MVEPFRSKLEDVYVHESGWWRASPILRVIKLPLLDRANKLPDGRPMFARLTTEEQEEFGRAKLGGAKLLKMDHVWLVWREGVRLDPVTLVRTAADTARMRGRDFCEAHDRRVWDQLERIGWDGTKPVANVGKDSIRRPPEAVRRNPDAMRNGGWITVGPDGVAGTFDDVAIQGGGDGSEHHNRRYTDYSQLSRYVIEDGDGEVDEAPTPVDTATPEIGLGSKGPAVTRWQAFLVRQGFNIGRSGPRKDGVDGDFGTLSQAATRGLQGRMGLPGTGRVDAATWRLYKATPIHVPAVTPPTPAKPATFTTTGPVWSAEKPLPRTVKLVSSRKLAKHFRWAKDRAIRLIVLHTMEALELLTTAEACANYFANPGTRNSKKTGKDEPVVASAHFCSDADSTVQCVPVEFQAAAAPGANHDGVHIEMAGYARQTVAEWADPYSSAMLARVAELTAALCRDLGIPPTFLTPGQVLAGDSGITTHAVISAVYRKSDHTDPGLNFPARAFEALVRQAFEQL